MSRTPVRPPWLLSVRAWHSRGAAGQVVMALISLAAALVAGDGLSRALSYSCLSTLVATLLWALVRRRSGPRWLLAWPVLSLVLLMVASVVIPGGALLTVSFIVVCFLFVGVTQPPRSSLVLIAPALVAQWLILDLPGPQAAIRMSIAVCVWLAVAELPAWLTHSLRIARQELVQLAATDPLTGLANRRGWEPVLEELLREAHASDSTLHLLVADLDHFKAYNDRYGHSAGDDFLREFARALVIVTPAHALVARWGGEEFVVALPGATHPTALQTAERIRTSVPDGQSCSIGLTTASPDDTPQTLLSRADAALYRAKDDGRDRVVIAAA